MVKIYCDKKDTMSSGSYTGSSSGISTYEKNYIISDGYGRTFASTPVSKAEYDLLLLQVSELRKRIDEVEERERTLIKMLMEERE